MTQSMPTKGRSSSFRSVFDIVRALVAGLVFWGFLQAREPYFAVPAEYHIRGIGESSERWTAYLAQQRRVDRLNAPVDFAVLGALLAVAVASGAFPCCTTWVRVGVAIPIGCLAGGVAGWVGCLAHQTFAPYDKQPTMLDTIIVQAAFFGSLGIGVGVLAGLYLRSWKGVLRGVAAGALGGLLAGMIFPLLASVLMPSSNTEALIPPEKTTQLLWLGLGTGLLGLIIPIGTIVPIQPAATATLENSPAD